MWSVRCRAGLASAAAYVLLVAVPAKQREEESKRREADATTPTTGTPAADALSVSEALQPATEEAAAMPTRPSPRGKAATGPSRGAKKPAA